MSLKSSNFVSSAFNQPSNSFFFIWKRWAFNPGLNLKVACSISRFFLIFGREKKFKLSSLLLDNLTDTSTRNPFFISIPLNLLSSLSATASDIHFLDETVSKSVPIFLASHLGLSLILKARFFDPSIHPNLTTFRTAPLSTYSTKSKVRSMDSVLTFNTDTASALDPVNTAFLKIIEGVLINLILR
ncbi:hypothetical protein PGT21_031084 [Puccinia graminis f. sp. tritici]|uniref:Uncharacterized protein n=1 Tax=Puccinia graminis f. sp. tritici TaxID=56615 RepID=A0A5B0QQC6_PUCGR|nr:hypothetical protein PGT21_031084 [Puccinia graminis f. sp. tritici]